MQRIAGKHSFRNAGKLFSEYPEDDFAKLWVETVLSTDEALHHDEIEVHKMEGDGTAVLVNKYHNKNPNTTYKSICIIDGDSSQQESDHDKVYRLPGEYPESYIYDKVVERIESSDSIIGELTVALHKPYETQEQVRKIINEVRLTNRDYHLLFSQVGKKLGFISEVVVKSAFLNIWIRSYPDEVALILNKIKVNYL